MKKSLILFFICICVSVLGCRSTKREIFILPRGFTGYVVLIYDQNSGLPIRLEGDKRVYRIPPNGILLTQASLNSDWLELPEFYYDEINPSSQIPFKIDYKDLPMDSTVAYGGISGSANKDLAGNEVVKFSKYFIGNKNQIDTAYQRAEKLDITKLVE